MDLERLFQSYLLISKNYMKDSNSEFECENAEYIKLYKKYLQRLEMVWFFDPIVILVSFYIFQLSLKNLVILVGINYSICIILKIYVFRKFTKERDLILNKYSKMYDKIFNRYTYILKEKMNEGFTQPDYFYSVSMYKIKDKKENKNE